MDYEHVSMPQIGLEPPLEVVDARIETRFAQWLEQGLLDEVRALDERGLSVTAAQAVGYKELLAYLRGECGLDEAVAAALQATRRLVRRQRSWFRRDPRVTWCTSVDEATEQLFGLLLGARP